MDRYLIESPHSEKQCLQAAQTMFAAGFLLNFEWGCEDGVHIAYAMIESENRKQALLLVPPNLRSDARAIRLIKIDPAELESARTEGRLSWVNRT
ncbi:MAG: hypothetical protein ACE1ZC_04835 [Nitrososphaerales archaeon]